MKRLIIFFLGISIINSCKALITPEIIEVIKEDIEDVEESRSYLCGKIINTENEPISFVAIKLMINEKSCLNAYSDFDGDFCFSLDISKINSNSYYQIVYKGVSEKIVPYNQFENKIITIERGIIIVSKEKYKRFYEEIRRCGN